MASIPNPAHTTISTTKISATANADEAAQHVAQGLQELFIRYVQQALHGCGDFRCIEATCHTGRVNTSQQPVRRYNARSARVIALALCATTQPRSHLCPYFDGNRSSDNTEGAETARDESNLMQLLCDTQSIVSLSEGISGFQVRMDPELERINERVSKMLSVASRIPSPSGAGFLSNEQLADGLFDCFKWLLSKAPLQRMAPWSMVNRDIISKGYAYPPQHGSLPVDEQYNTWQAILDLLEHAPYLSLLGRIMAVITGRLELQRILQAVAEKSDSKSTFTRSEQSVERLLAIRICTDNNSTSTKVLAVVVLLKKLLTKVWDSRPIVEESSPAFAALQVLSHLHDQFTPDLPPESFKMPLIVSRVGIKELATSFADGNRGRGLHILTFNSVFSFAELSLIFRTINHLTMRRAEGAVRITRSLRRNSGNVGAELSNPPTQLQHAEQYYLLLNVTRGSVLRDAFDQLWQRRKGELRRPLRVRLGEADELEIGHDLGGVQIEFFNLVCKEAFAEEAQIFTTDAQTGMSYFRPGSLQPLHMFELLGMLVALALYNGIALPINLPWVFYAQLRGIIDPPVYPKMCAAAIQDGWPTVANSLNSILQEDVPGLDFTFPLEANGLRLTVLLPYHDERSHGARRELQVVDSTGIAGVSVDLEDISESWPGWTLTAITDADDIAEVTPVNKHNYVQDYCRFLCYESVAPQCDAFFRGFHTTGLLQPRDLGLFAAEDLKAHLEGTDYLDMHELRNCTRYEGFDPDSRYIASFWKIVTSWPESRQKQLLKFVTAAERIPVTGTKSLKFVIKRSSPETLDMLPTSSTCFGTLYLPRYQNPDILAAKLNLALKYGSEGFGTG